jgi:hypothetical protein
MYYKVIKNNKVIDVLDKLVYLRYQEKHDRMVLCDKSKAQAFFSSDRKNIWHTETLYELPIDKYDEVDLIEIDEYEYKQLKVLNGKTPQEILEEYTLLLISEGVI